MFFYIILSIVVVIIALNFSKVKSFVVHMVKSAHLFAEEYNNVYKDDDEAAVEKNEDDTDDSKQQKKINRKDKKAQ
jgi:hypothetical protein